MKYTFNSKGVVLLVSFIYESVVYFTDQSFFSY